MPDFSWDAQYNELIFAIMAVTVGFNVYWFLSKSEKIRGAWKKKLGDEAASIRATLVEKTNGFVFLGVIPGIIAFIWFGKPPAEYGLNLDFGGNPETIYWIVGLACVIWPANYFSSKNPKHHEHYPQIRKAEWSKGLLAKHLGGWALYLFGYEFLFRGILLFASVPILGVWGAIMLNVSLYSVTHLPKGAGETFGAIPLGLLLSWITLRTGNIWVAFFVHLNLASSNAIFSLKHHPGMRLVGKSS